MVHFADVKISFSFVAFFSSTSSIPKGVPKGGQGGHGPHLMEKYQFLKKFGISGQKNGILPPLNFFFIFPPSKISPGYALVNSCRQILEFISF